MIFRRKYIKTKMFHRILLNISFNLFLFKNATYNKIKLVLVSILCYAVGGLIQNEDFTPSFLLLLLFFPEEIFEQYSKRQNALFAANRQLLK